MALKKLLGQKIQHCRKSRGWSQEKLAEFVGVSTNSISQAEAGETFPKPENLESLCSVFDMSYAELFTFDDLPEQNPAILANIQRYLAIFNNIELAYVLDCIKAYARLKRKKQ